MRRLRQGRIEYLDAAGRSRGRERFSLLVDADGLRTLQVTCEIDATDLVRHVVQTVDRRFRPREAYVRVAKGGRLTAAGWLCFESSIVDVATQSGAAAPQRRQVVTPQPVLAYGSHPLIVDGWVPAGFDLAGPAVQPVREAYLSSYEFDGSGTVDLLPIAFDLEYLGRERLEVGAGRFECDHFRYRLDGSPMQHPPYETWVTTDGEFTLVQARTGAPTHYRYELVEFDAAAS